MAPAPAELTYVFDENLGGLPAILKLARTRPLGSILSLRDLGYEGARDADWMAALGASERYVVLTRDSAILSVAAQSAAWRGSGLRLFMLGRDWGRMSAPELARGILYWWPAIVEYSRASGPGTAWLVTHRVPEPPAGGIRPVTGSAPPSAT